MTSILKAPFTCIIAGPTGSGKTQFTLKLIKYSGEMIKPAPQRIIWCYGIYQNEFDSYKNLVDFHEGLLSPEQFRGISNTLLVIDDLMAEAGSEVMNIFTKGSHHNNVSVCFLTQNLYYGGKHNRTMNLNTHYMVLFKNPRDATQIQVLSRQMFPLSPKYLQESFRDSTSSEPYSYLFVDLKPDTDDRLRLRAKIFPDDFPYHYVYVPK